MSYISTKTDHLPTVAIIGGGPAGLMAAEIISATQQIQVKLFERMPSVGRKLLIAGIGGLNISHSEPLDLFYSRYIPKESMSPYLKLFGRDQLLNWCHQLGIETFTGSSGRIFPKGMKAAPLLRAWLKRLKAQGVTFYTKHHWQGWNDQGQLLFNSPLGNFALQADASLLALGGASYPRLGTDGTWLSYLTDQGIDCAPWQATNCGFETDWSDFFKEKYAGTPLKQITCFFKDSQGQQQQQLGELLISRYGVEGSIIYALSSAIRKTINKQGTITLYLDLFPQLSYNQLQEKLTKPKGSQSISNFLRKQINLKEAKMGLLRELAPHALTDLATLAEHLKALPLILKQPRPLTEAISSAGGVCFNELTDQLMLKKLPSIFCAGEMLDWEAPTGGYLLTGCFSTGYVAAQGIINYLSAK